MNEASRNITNNIFGIYFIMTQLISKEHYMWFMGNEWS